MKYSNKYQDDQDLKSAADLIYYDIFDTFLSLILPSTSQVPRHTLGHFGMLWDIHGSQGT